MIYTNEQLRKEVIRYLNEHWKEDVSSEQIASEFGYTTRYFNKKFREIFSWPFGQYVTKLKLRRVAALMIEQGGVGQIGQYAGFSNSQSFSKGFRKEFGMSPKQFLCSLEEIPDMPFDCKIRGNKIRAEYLMIQPMTLHGWLLSLEDNREIDLTKERGYYFDHYDDRVEIDWRTDRTIGMWWHDASCELNYFIGKIAEQDGKAPKGMVKIYIPEEYYIKLSVSLDLKEQKRKKQYSVIIKELACWAKEEWMVLNQKTYYHTASIFEQYDSGEVSLYIPLPKRNWVQTNPAEGEGTEAWTAYIDKHITKELTVQDLAEHFHYSERHFRDTFLSYYNISPANYIKKRRLYLIAKEIRDGNVEVNQIIRKYDYSSLQAFHKDFYQEFQVDPETYKEEYNPIDMKHYYSVNKQMLKISFQELEQFIVTGKNVILPVDKEQQVYNQVKYIVNALERKDGDLSRVSGGLAEKEKFIFWQTEYETEEIVCLVCAKQVEKEKVEDSLWQVKIKKGIYAIVEERKESDTNSLEERYQMLYRCAFGGWVKEHRARIDFNRLAFFRYANDKLQCYIPVNE